MNSETEDGNKSMELLIEEETKEANRDNSQSQRINEFINDLKEAIESGKLHQTNMLQQSAAQLNKLINVDNLSNQTFTYIINWLKQQQEKKTNLNFTNKEEEELYGHHSDINLASDVAEEVDKGVVVVEVVDDSEDSGEMDLATEIKFLRNKIKASELDKDKMMAKINELQKENLDLKTKLLMRPGQQSYSLPLDDATQNEINNLKILVQELIKSNDEKDKKLDELTKQVIRFKRIQEIVLSAQAPIKSKNYDDLSFEMNPPSTTSQSAAATAATTTTTTMTEIHMTHSSYATAPNGAMTTQLDDNQHTSSSSSAGSSNKADQQQPQESAQQKQTGTSNADPTSQIISSCSLTSSISSSSSSASSSSSTSSASSDSSINSAQHHHQSPATTTTTSNNAPLTAPLATITEFINYSSSSTLATPNPSLTCSQHNNNRQHNLSSDTLTNVDALNTMSMSTANTGQQQQTEPSKQQQKSVEGMKTISNPIKEKLLFEAAFGKSSKSISKSASNKAAKYSSAVSLSATSSPNQNEYTNSKKHSALNSFKLTLSPNKSNNTSTNHHSSNRSLRNFFGKLIRTSLVNINESTFGGQNNSSSNNNNKHEGNSQTLDNKAVSLQQQLQVQMPTSPKTPSSSSNPFKRGGLRSTANARLQNAYTYGGSRHHHHHGSNNNEATSSSVIAVPSHVDMLTFAKWPSAHVCEWLARHGFDAYFPVNTESGQRVNKFIKNGLQLLQATQYDYERELGIKNPLHRKKLGILLQGLYSTLSPDPNNCQTIEQINLTQLDQHWVTKWLDDIGLPQYKDTFNEHMIDGRMLHHLSQEDFATLSINSELHYLSIKWAIHVLRLNNFDPHCLRRRPSGDEALDRAECSLWTNHRCMEWLRSIDLSEYAPNLRGSGVHGGLLVFEARFNPQCLADILSIPASKTLLRRHLSTLFSDLIGPEMCKLKRDAQSQSGYVQLTAQSKVKHVKPKSSGHHHHHSHQHGGSGLIFTNALGGTHKRTKSQDSRDFLGLPMALVDKLNQQQLQHQQHQQMMIARASSKTMNVGQSATLPLGSSSIYSDNIEEVSNKSTTIKYVR